MNLKLYLLVKLSFSFLWITDPDFQKIVSSAFSVCVRHSLLGAASSSRSLPSLCQADWRSGDHHSAVRNWFVIRHHKSSHDDDLVQVASPLMTTPWGLGCSGHSPIQHFRASTYRAARPSPQTARWDPHFIIDDLKVKAEAVCRYMWWFSQRRFYLYFLNPKKVNVGSITEKETKSLCNSVWLDLDRHWERHESCDDDVF